jgi:hypothetical protein
MTTPAVPANTRTATSSSTRNLVLNSIESDYTPGDWGLDTPSLTLPLNKGERTPSLTTLLTILA